jgi:twitching motility two-component system response regulator PilH
MRPGSPLRWASLHTDPYNILLVQSDPLKRQTCTVVLEEAGFTVRAAADAARALERVESCPPDIVVTDLVLPDMDGGALCRRLREHPRMRDAQIFGVSRSTTSADYVRALKAGFDLLLKEPCDPGTLVTEIGRVRVHAAGLRRRAQLAVARASIARSDAASVLAHSHSIREKYERRTRGDTLARIRSAYYELPGLNLTIAQAARLWQLDAHECAAVLVELVHRQFLACRDGTFCRRRCGPAAEAPEGLFLPR